MALLKRRTEPRQQGRNFRWLYQSARWHRFSRNFLKRPENRLCRECLEQGKTEVSEVTDHVIPLVIWVNEMGRDPYDLSNLQPLSKRCHNRKTANERKRKR